MDTNCADCKACTVVCYLASDNRLQKKGHKRYDCTDFKISTVACQCDLTGSMGESNFSRLCKQGRKPGGAGATRPLEGVKGFQQELEKILVGGFNVVLKNTTL